MKVFRAGTLFAVPLSDSEYATGRVLFDAGSDAGDLIPPFSGHGGTFVIEVYRQTHAEPSAERSDVLLPHLVTRPSMLDDDSWVSVGHEPVDLTEIEFPVTHMGHQQGAVICRGDVALPVDLTTDDLREIADRARPGTAAPALLPCNILYELGRKEECPYERLREGHRASAAKRDLRNYDEFEDIVERITIDRELRRDDCYYDFALYHGSDTRRFFVEMTEGGDILLCPYCHTAIEEDEVDCPHCERDTTADARLQLTPEQYCHTDRQDCLHCGAQLIKGAVACWTCTEWQS